MYVYNNGIVKHSFYFLKQQQYEEENNYNDYDNDS